MSIVTIGDFKNYLQTVANAVSSGKMNVNDAEVVSVLQTIADRLGEVSANPTANTALARLKALEGYLDGVEAALGAQADAEATGNGSLIAIVKRLRTILTDVWNDAANALNVQLTGRKAKIDSASYDQVLNVAASGSTIITITPPAGELWKIKNLYFDILGPAGATSGTHIIEVTYGPTYDPKRRIMALTSNFDKRIRLQDNMPHADVTTKTPNNDAIIQSNVLSFILSNAVPLILRYVNNTNATQTGTLAIMVTREVEYIA